MPTFLDTIFLIFFYEYFFKTSNQTRSDNVEKWFIKKCFFSLGQAEYF